MHLVTDEPNKQMNQLRSEMSSSTPKNSLGSALKNKIKGVGSKLRSAAGAPGRFIVETRHKDKMKKLDRDFQFLKEYNTKDRLGAPISNVDRSKFQMYNK